MSNYLRKRGQGVGYYEEFSDPESSDDEQNYDIDVIERENIGYNNGQSDSEPEGEINVQEENFQDEMNFEDDFPAPNFDVGEFPHLEEDLDLLNYREEIDDRGLNFSLTYMKKK